MAEQRIWTLEDEQAVRQFEKDIADGKMGKRTESLEEEIAWLESLRTGRTPKSPDLEKTGSA